MEASELYPGVRAVEHTADVAIAVRADSLAQLFHRAAMGMLALIHGEDEPESFLDLPPPPPQEEPGAAPEQERRLSLEADQLSALLLLWLRELLYLYEVHDLVYREAAFERLDDRGLEAHLRLGAPERQAVRELKGVTYHGLEVRREPEGWRATVIFDV